jgi:type II secretory pathway pseudopilin PulG
MRSSRTIHRTFGAKRRRAAFTLTEVLAALAFMAIVIPVAVQGVRVASLAGEIGQRKAAAARIAESVLNDQIVSGTWQSAEQNGTVAEGALEYRWKVSAEPWSEDAMSLLTVEVTVPIQGKDYEVRLNTLVDSAAQ